MFRGNFMTDHQLTITQIKSDLMDMWNEATAGYTYMQWFEAARQLLNNHFGIKKANFFIFNENKTGFIPLEGHQSFLKRRIEIPNELIEVDRVHSQELYLKLFRKEGFEYADELVVFNDESFMPLALLLIESTSKWRAFSASSYFGEFVNVISDLIRGIERISLLEIKEKNFRQLFNVAELFNSTMSSEIILEGIMDTITDLFTSFEVNLLLSHDQKELTHSYQLFDYINERPSAIDAFVSGEIRIEKVKELSLNLLNAPIKGRQGTYGVLQIKTPVDYIFTSTQRNFIRMLSKTAGSALENASLYDQSHRLIEDLRLVNETSRKLTSNMHFSEMISYLKQQLFKAIQPDEIAFVMYNENETNDVSEESTGFFKTAEGDAYIRFVAEHLRGGKESLFDANFSATVKEIVTYEAVIAIPVTSQEEVLGFIICLNKTSYTFSFEKFKLVGLLIGHASLALANSILRDQLQELVDKDHLTKLFTRRYLDDVVEKSIEQNEGGTFLLLDIDDFKHINDRYGHSVGDTVLKQIGSFILTEVEEVGVPARWGGEEFAIYLPFTSQAEAEKIATQLINKIPTASTPVVTVSAGMSSWIAGQEITLKELFQSTDLALYAAKYKGKNQVAIHGKQL